MDVTQSFAATFVDELAAQGVDFACISPGSRSAPIAIALQRHPKIRVFVQIDERSGSFFGVGLAKATGKPVVLLCTSGTAAAEFHPAVVEAFHSRTPLIVLTADRPPELREVGANQAIDQQRLYGTAVRWFFDPGAPVELPTRPDRGAALRRARTRRPPAGPCTSTFRSASRWCRRRAGPGRARRRQARRSARGRTAADARPGHDAGVRAAAVAAASGRRRARCGTATGSHRR